jgi:serine/threonine-protein kinase RsbW
MTARLPAGPAAVARAIAAGRKFAEDRRLSADVADRLAVVVEEWVANVVEHGAARAGSRIILRIDQVEDAIRVIATDAGRPFDPRTAVFQEPNPERGGGAGLEIIRAWSRLADYRRRAGRNRLVLELPLS